MLCGVDKCVFKLLPVWLCFVCLVQSFHLVKKCCKDGEHLNNDDFRTCESINSTISNFSEILDTFHEKFGSCYGNSSKLCLDTTENGIYVIQSQEAPQEFVSRTCCFDNTETAEEMCSNDGDELTMSEYNNTCTESTRITEKGNLRILDGTATKASYSVRVCKTNKKPSGDGAVYNKCCREGESYGKDLTGCKVASSRSHPSFSDEESKIYQPNSYTIRSASPEMLTCDWLTYDSSEGFNFTILPNGSLLIKKNDIHYQPYSFYCTETVELENSGRQEISYVCDNSTGTTPTGKPHVGITLYFWFYVLALPFLVATFAVYLALPELRNLRGKIVMSHVLSLLSFYLLMTVINKYIPDKSCHLPCVLLGVCAHFSFLSSFAWLAVKGFDLCLIQSLRRWASPPHFLYYCIFGWGVPMIIVGFGLVNQFYLQPFSDLVSPDYGVKYCFVDKSESHKAMFYYVFTPLGILLFINLATFVVFAIITWKYGMIAERLSPTSHGLLKARMLNVFRIFLAMGLTWIFDLLSYVFQGEILLWVVTDILNILTAVLIFYVYICKPHVSVLLATRYPNLFSFLRRSDNQGASVASLTTRSCTPTKTVSNIALFRQPENQCH